MVVVVVVVVLVLALVGSPAVVGHPHEQQHRRRFDSRPAEKVVDPPLVHCGPASEEARCRTPTAVGWLEKILPF